MTGSLEPCGHASFALLYEWLIFSSASSVQKGDCMHSQKNVQQIRLQTVLAEHDLCSHLSPVTDVSCLGITHFVRHQVHVQSNVSDQFLMTISHQLDSTV